MEHTQYEEYGWLCTVLPMGVRVCNSTISRPMAKLSTEVDMLSYTMASKHKTSRLQDPGSVQLASHEIGHAGEYNNYPNTRLQSIRQTGAGPLPTH